MGKYIVLVSFSLSIIFAVIISLVLLVSKEDNVWNNKELSSLASTSVKLLPGEIQEWHERGKYVEINGFKMFYILLNIRNDDLETKQNINNKFRDPGDTTLILIHGFPTSSFDYHRALDKYLIPQLKKNTGKLYIGNLSKYIAIQITHVQLISIRHYFTLFNGR